MVEPAAPGADEESVPLFVAFMDVLYPAVLGEAPWTSALHALFVLGSGRGARRRMLFDAALRQLRHALAIGRRLAARSEVLECASAALPCGVLLLDARATVLFASERAHRLLCGRKGIQLDRGKLRSLKGLEDSTLARGLSRLLGLPGRDGGAVCIELPPQGEAGALRLMLMRSSDEAGTTGAVLCLVFERHATAHLPGCGLLRDIYGFSAAEAELAGLLLAGQSLGDAARSRSVSLNTAKSQLRNVLRKTGARNQAELMRTLIGGPAGLLQGLTAAIPVGRPSA